MSSKMPTVQELFNPLLSALRALGGSGSITEIDDKVVEIQKYPEELVSVLHDPEKSTRTQIGYRLAWARTYLKKFGVLDNSSRAIWALTPKANEYSVVDPREVVQTVRKLDSESEPTEEEVEEPTAPEEVDSEVEQSWKQKLHALLTNDLSPAAFERLVQRLLREAGFVQVEVTGRSGDGGIDGKGIARVNGLLSFHVLFQCKRYQGSIGPPKSEIFVAR